MKTWAVARVHAQQPASCSTLFRCIVQLRRFNDRDLFAVKSLAAAASPLSVRTVVNQCQSQCMRSRDPFAVYNSHFALLNKMLLRPYRYIFT
jgi:hypothetical protein